ncbi:MAG TPA: DUF4296 domain-containing protein [Chryseosolibacter sp.]|nr:DUF4296 domain-containing protein [Chryseosolibacter sp.]
MKKIKAIITSAVLAVIAAGALMSCGEKKPEGILSRAEMVSIMEEMYIAEEKVNHLTLKRDSAKIVFEAMEERVFEKAAVSDSLFKRSFDYYMEHPREMELIYTALVDSLQLREQRAPFSADHE